MKTLNLPKKIPVFPLSNFIIFPKTSVPLNIFEPRYIDMINDAMKLDKMIGMIQPKNSSYIDDLKPELHSIGCLGKITSFKATEDQRYLIELKGLIRFKIIGEFRSDKKYREFEKSLKHKNFIFTNGVDLIHNLFNIERKIKNNALSKSIQLIGNNYSINKIFMKIADKGI